MSVSVCVRSVGLEGLTVWSLCCLRLMRSTKTRFGVCASANGVVIQGPSGLMAVRNDFPSCVESCTSLYWLVQCQPLDHLTPAVPSTTPSTTLSLPAQDDLTERESLDTLNTTFPKEKSLDISPIFDALHICLYFHQNPLPFVILKMAHVNPRHDNLQEPFAGPHISSLAEFQLILAQV